MRDVPELLITGREREYFTWYEYSVLGIARPGADGPFRFIKNEAYTPTGIDDDAIDEYVSKFSQPGGLRSMFNICKRPCSSSLRATLADSSSQIEQRSQTSSRTGKPPRSSWKCRFSRSAARRSSAKKSESKWKRLRARWSIRN